jgi:Cdc6-like AAA superfamily ATPase
MFKSFNFNKPEEQDNPDQTKESVLVTKIPHRNPYGCWKIVATMEHIFKEFTKTFIDPTERIKDYWKIFMGTVLPFIFRDELEENIKLLKKMYGFEIIEKNVLIVNEPMSGKTFFSMFFFAALIYSAPGTVVVMEIDTRKLPNPKEFLIDFYNQICDLYGEGKKLKETGENIFTDKCSRIFFNEHETIRGADIYFFDNIETTNSEPLKTYLNNKERVIATSRKMLH